MKTRITKIFNFEAAHQLKWHQGKCKNLHGHTYKLEVTIEGEINQEGIVLDFGDLKKIVNKEIIEIYDHSYLNNHLENPSAELIAQKIFDTLKLELNITNIKLWETPNSYVEVIE